MLNEVWIRVVGLLLHLWQPEILKNMGNACGGFLALDKEITLHVKISGARMFVKMGRKIGSSVVNILEGSRSFELQIWWEIPPWLAYVYLEIGNGRVTEKLEKPKEEDDIVSHASKCVELLHPRCINNK